MLTAAQEDYVEVIYRLEEQLGQGEVRITDIAERLGTRLPTVTRTVQKLTEAGLVKHASRRSVALSPMGRRVARDILHRHTDLVAFFTDILGLHDRESEQIACQIEHGLSAKAAQRFHEFLNYIQELPAGERQVLDRFLERVSKGKKDFQHLPAGKIRGWRT